MERLAILYGQLLDAMLIATCGLLLAMTFLIGLDVLLRNVGLGGIPPSNELSEHALYLMTILAAPALLRRGQHIRIDIVLRMLPLRIGWFLEWVGDVAGFVCSVLFLAFAVKVMLTSYAAGSLSIKTLVMPEWWIYAPMPFCFLMLAVEFIFRMRLLMMSDRRPRDEATSAA
jgi:TRAP-type C4-dicarboxylate transport system permease small subunit